MKTRDRLSWLQSSGGGSSSSLLVGSGDGGGGGSAEPEPESPTAAEGEEWPFCRPFHVIINIAVGGSWGGRRGIDDDAFPATMEVKFVKVFQGDW